jgi:hypothetical protein
LVNYETTLSITLLLSLDWLRDGARESNSSINIMQGLFYFALRNICRMFFSDSPIYILSSSGPFIEINSICSSDAIDFAKRVLPQPGGPYISIPFLGSISLLKMLGKLRQMFIVFFISSFASTNPPTSLKSLSSILLLLLLSLSLFLSLLLPSSSSLISF